MKQQLASALLIIIGLFGFAAGAKAETHAEVIVKIPYEFVAGGRTLPAGTYRVSRSDDRRSVLSIVSREQGAGVFVLANQFENHPGDDAKVSLEQVGGTYFLRAIETPDGVYTLALPRSAVLMVKSAPKNDMSASGTN